MSNDWPVFLFNFLADLLGFRVENRRPTERDVVKKNNQK